MDFSLIVVCSFAYAGALGGAGAYVAIQKNRDWMEGSVMAVLFGPFGLIVEACLPTNQKGAENPLHTSSRDTVAPAPVQPIASSQTAVEVFLRSAQETGSASGRRS
jgi:hypothetical protein